MKRCIVFFMVLILLVPMMFASAQGDDDLSETFTSDDSRLTFSYPEGWFVNIDEEDESISVSNVEGLNPDIAEALPSGQASISILVGTPDDFEEDGFVFPLNTSAEFMAGFWTGFYSFANLFASAFSGEPLAVMTIGTVEALEINGEEAALVQIDLEDTQSALLIVMPSTETSVRTLIVTSAFGEMDDYQDIAIAMLESVEFTP